MNTRLFPGALNSRGAERAGDEFEKSGNSRMLLAARKRKTGNTFFGDLDRSYESFFVEVHFIDASHTVIGIGFAQWPAMINDEPLVGLCDMNH